MPGKQKPAPPKWRRRGPTGSLHKVEIPNQEIVGAGIIVDRHRRQDDDAEHDIGDILFIEGAEYRPKADNGADHSGEAPGLGYTGSRSDKCGPGRWTG